MKLAHELDFGADYFFYEDKSVLINDDYTYALLTYDSNDNFSYPVSVTASLSDWPTNCYQIDNQ